MGGPPRPGLVLLGSLLWGHPADSVLRAGDQGQVPHCHQRQVRQAEEDCEGLALGDSPAQSLSQLGEEVSVQESDVHTVRVRNQDTLGLVIMEEMLFIMRKYFTSKYYIIF